MKVKTILMNEARCCDPETPLWEAARLMWDGDFGFIPVRDSATGRLEGVVTDRDLCMSALLSARSLDDLRVRDAMSKRVRSVRPDDDLRRVHIIMREQQVRRVPVVDGGRRLLGVVSLNDLAVEAFSGRGPAAARRQREVGKTLAAVSRHRIETGN
jgi:CBS domain-containing protein